MSDLAAPTRDGKPTSAELWANAKAAFRRRDYAAAADLLGELAMDRLGEPDLDVAAVRLQYGVTLLRLGRTEDGVAQLRLAVELDPGDSRAQHKLGAGLARLGREEEALPFFERAVSLAPDVAEHRWRLGEQHRRLGRSDEARAAFERALELDPDYRPARKGLEALKRKRRSWLGGIRRFFRGG